MTLKEREQYHRYKSNASGSKDIPKNCEWRIVLIEECAIDMKIVREQFYYDKLKPLYNLRNPKTDTKEYQKKYSASHKEEKKAYDATRKEQRKAYKAANREQMNARQNARRLIARTAVVHQSVTVAVSS
jgi:hypothetical protein